MKVQNITDIEGFFKAIDGCKGKVELVTGEGDRLNLKSKLSQYVSLATIFSNGEIPEMEIVAHEKEDCTSPPGRAQRFSGKSFVGGRDMVQSMVSIRAKQVRAWS